MKAKPRTHVVRLIILCAGLMPLVACDDDEARKRQADAQRQVQAQLEAEQAQRRRAEQAILSAEQAHGNWTVTVVVGACSACIIVGLAGVAIGSRALNRSRKEQRHG